jgi:hypothetical protein
VNILREITRLKEEQGLKKEGKRENEVFRSKKERGLKFFVNTSRISSKLEGKTNFSLDSLKYMVKLNMS